MKDQLQKLIDKYKVELAVEKGKPTHQSFVVQTICISIINDLTKLLEENK